jgi:uncharacterized protein (DUF885 family)
VLPAYVQFTKFVRDEYAPEGRIDPGIWALSDRNARYALDVRESAITDLAPQEIHEIGLTQVKEIEGRMLAVANQLGYKDGQTFNAAIAIDPKLHGHSCEEILDLYRKYMTRCIPNYPSCSGICPKLSWRSIQ